MKILMLAPYIYQDGENFSKNKTGFGYMVADIAHAVAAEGCEVFLATHSLFTKKRVVDGVTLVKRTPWDLAWNLRFSDIKWAWKAMKLGQSLEMKLKNAFYFLSLGYVSYLIKHIKPDIVHIHGIDISTVAFMQATISAEIPFLVTLHGLNSFDESVKLDEKNKQVEMDFLNLCERKRKLYTVVSSGVKKRIVDKYAPNGDKYIQVITNGTGLCKDNANETLVREKYNIPKQAKVVLCIGTLCRCKNQAQLISAFAYLGTERVENIYLLLVGSDAYDDELQRQVTQAKLNNCVIFCGFVPRNEVCNYYAAADMVALISYSEGFGLSLVEGFLFGKPALCFCDMDVTLDIHEENAIYLMKNRDTTTVAEAIVTMLSKQWNSEGIKDYAEKFTLQRMAKNYLAVYDDVHDNMETITCNELWDML